MIKKYLLALSLSLMLAPSAFAEELAISEISETDAVAVEDSAMLCGGGCGYWGGVYINVSTTVSAEVDTVSLYGSYYIDNAESKTDAIDELSEVYKTVQSQLSKYGTVHRTGISTYSDWEYTNMYDGSISIKVTLFDSAQTEGVENIMYKNNFDAWREITVVSTTAAEKEAVPTLKGLIADKKEVYEELLENELGAISNVNVYSWADSYSFDPSTNMVNVMVYADVTYNTAQY
jgi:hypothetical protein